MKITNIEAISCTMPLRTPYRIAYQEVEEATNVFVRVETSSGLTGWGCAAPDADITWETPGSVRRAVRTVTPLLVGQDPLRIGRIVTRLQAAIPRQMSALAGIDMALHDLLGKAAGMPLWKLLGGFRRSIRTSVTIGILPEDETVRAAQARADEGFRCLKLKGGLDPEEDARRLRAVRAAVGPRVALRFDANQGYSVEQAARFVEVLAEVEIELLEQPTPRGKPDLLGRVTRAAPMPVMADESLMNLRDAFALVRGDLVDLVNVKLMKVGGLWEALQVNAVARSAGVGVMVGCMDESALAIAAGLHYALARPNVHYADLDGHLDLDGDPAAGAVRCVKGVLSPHPGPGLGFDPVL